MEKEGIERNGIVDWTLKAWKEKKGEESGTREKKRSREKREANNAKR
jgi:hypothetical protein